MLCGAPFAFFHLALATLSFLVVAQNATVARATEVDLLLALAADVSGSVDDEKFSLQRDGYAAAITSPRVIEAPQSGRLGRIAICYIEWSGIGNQRVLIDWTVIEDAASAQRFAIKLAEAPRPRPRPLEARRQGRHRRCVLHGRSFCSGRRPLAGRRPPPPGQRGGRLPRLEDDEDLALRRRHQGADDRSRRARRADPVRRPARVRGHPGERATLTANGRPVLRSRTAGSRSRGRRGRRRRSPSSPPTRCATRRPSASGSPSSPGSPAHPIRAVHMTSDAWADDGLRNGVLDLIAAGPDQRGRARPEGGGRQDRLERAGAARAQDRRRPRDYEPRRRRARRCTTRACA